MFFYVCGADGVGKTTHIKRLINYYKIQNYVWLRSPKIISKFGSLYKGLIATGDMFISNREKINQLSKEITGLYAVEMEGAAFAQVSIQEKVNWLVLRTISDEANENSSEDFSKFLIKYNHHTAKLISALIENIDR